MGNNTDKEDKKVEQIEQIKKEKEKILKGSYKDRFKVEKKDPLNFYDMIIEIDSFSKKPEIIWKILTKSEEMIEKKIEELKEDKEIDNEEGNEEVHNEEVEKKEIDNKQNNENPIKAQIKQELEEKDKISQFNEDNIIVLGVIGLGNVGKSYLLSLFTGEEFPTGDSIHTKGISIKKKKKLIILDSEGVEAPLTKSNISEDLYPKEGLLEKEINESDGLIQTIARDKKAVELFIQDFIIDKSSILFIVVGQLTLTEQKLINRIVNETNKKLIFVIHNLKNLYSKEQINDYIQNVFKKNIFLNFETFSEQKYKSGKNHNEEKNLLEEFNKYYIETYKINENLEKNVIHLIMASNVKESEAYYFNKTVVDYVRTEISSVNEGKQFNIVEELKQFVLKKSEKYVESEENLNFPFSEGDIKIVKEGNINCIKIKNKTKLKKCLINQLGFSSFYGGLYSPNYVCYFNESNNEKEKILVIDINLCGRDYIVNTPKREEITEEGHKTVITITGTKKLREYKNIEVLDGSTMESGNFRIDIVLDNNKYNIKSVSEVKKEKKKGIRRFIYTLLTDNNNINNNLEMKALNFNISKKEKPILKEDKKN